MTWQVRAGAALDTESCGRGTTFYLVDQRVNMVPEVLAEDVASLHANNDRLAFSVLWTIDEHANLLESAVRKTVIRSRASLSYADAQQKIDAQANGGGGGDALSSSLGILHSLALKLHRRAPDEQARLAREASRMSGQRRAPPARLAAHAVIAIRYPQLAVRERVLEALHHQAPQPTPFGRD